MYIKQRPDPALHSQFPWYIPQYRIRGFVRAHPVESSAGSIKWHVERRKSAHWIAAPKWIYLHNVSAAMPFSKCHYRTVKGVGYIYKGKWECLLIWEHLKGYEYTYLHRMSITVWQYIGASVYTGPHLVLRAQTGLINTGINICITTYV